MKNDIYRSKVLGDETTKPVKAELPLVEQAMTEEVAQLRAIVKLGDDAITTIRAIQANCKHHYFRDTAGFPYDVRHCAICGTSMGQL
jgi:hypothetical protein